MTNKRNIEEWVKKSHSLPGIKKNALIAYNFQSLGALDCDLIEDWKQFSGDLTSLENLSNFNKFSFQNSLWVMAGYEIMRIIKNNDPSKETQKVYELFRRVRIPLVKFEIPSSNITNNYSSDYGIAYTAVDGAVNEPGWLIGPGLFISRDSLAQSLFDLY